jgi:hypothetical protein
MNTPRLTSRRWLLSVSATALCGASLGVAQYAAAQESMPAPSPKPRTPPVPAYITSELPDARWIGSARMRFIAFDVYDAALWVAPGFRASHYAQSALALELTYLRNLKGQSIAERSIDEMRRGGVISTVQEKNWLAAMQATFPDVQAGDRITGVHQPTAGAQFWFNGQLRASVPDAEFQPPVFWNLAGRDHQRAPTAQRPAGRGRRMTTLSARHTAFTWQQGWRYGLMGLPLAFVALPLYVMLPNHYARSFGMPLATLGAVLLGARLFDAFIDPLLGRWSDRLFRQSTDTVLRWAAAGGAGPGRRLCLAVFSTGQRQQRTDGLAGCVTGGDVCGLQRPVDTAPVLGCTLGWRRGPAQPGRGLA